MPSPSRRIGLYPKSRSRGVLIDAGGARRRQEQLDTEHEKRVSEVNAATERVKKAGGKIPLLKSLDQIKVYTAYVESGYFTGQRRLMFPALQIANKLDIGDIFAAISQNHTGGPNAMAERHGETSVGPHFDGYSTAGFMPWTLHENLEGTGKVRAAFIGKTLHDAYTVFANSLAGNDEAQELLAQNRAFIGSAALAQARLVYEGDLKPGTRTLIWHGTNAQSAAAHDIVRNQPGDYRIYATQDRPTGPLPEGFVRL